MSDDSRPIALTVLAVVGGAVVGYLLFTDHGRKLRAELEAALEDAGRELDSFRNTAQKAAGLATDGWKLLNELAGEKQPEPQLYSSAGQTAPF